MSKALLLPLVSAVALVVSFPDASFYPLAWCALVPYLYWLGFAPTWRRLLLGHAVFAFGFFGGVLYWIPRVLVVYGGLPWAIGVFALVLMVLLLAAMLLPFSWLSALAARRSPTTLALVAPGMWTLTELLRNYIPFGGFPWATLGYTQAELPWALQTADLGSVYFISFLVVLVNGALLLLIRRQAFPVAAAILACALGVNLYGAWRYWLWDPVPGPNVRVGIAQGNIDLKSDLEHYADKYFRVLPRLFDQAVAAGARWVLFPEAQNPYRLEHDFYFRQFWSSRLQTSGAFLLVNSAADAEGGYYNSAYLLGPTGEIVHRYDKIHLVPFGEYLPLEGWWGPGQALVAEVSGFLPGSRPGVAQAAGVTFSTLICYEAIFPELSRAAVRQGAQILVNITNDGWFGDSAAPSQHLQMARVRAVETRRPLLRAANSGYSAVISPKGVLELRTELFTEDLLTADIAGGTGGTLYLAYGLLPTLAVIMLCTALGWIAPPVRAKGAKRGRRR